MANNKLIQIGALSLLSLALQQAQAACSVTRPAGNNHYLCESGNSGPFNDGLGNNTLVARGTSNIASVDFGAGDDQVHIASNAQIGAIREGDGSDSFFMTGGKIASLDQGDGFDDFYISGGTIVGAFVSGDRAKVSGGTIGRVDMKLDDNIFEMSGGLIIGNLVTGLGADTIKIEGGRIGGNVSTSGGPDKITVTDGEIDGEIRASEGDDRFEWNENGVIKSAILMGNGNDTALITHLTESQISSTPTVDGGLGNDQLTIERSTSDSAGRYTGWETVNLTRRSKLNLADDFVLGDSISGTGTFNIDRSSTLAVTQGTIRPHTAGQLVTLNNAGTIDMTTGSSAATDSLTVHGNYTGSGGQLWLQTVLGDDSSRTDKLVVDQGNISGNTQITVSNLNGPGAATLNNGIEVVQARNGAVSSADAFSLKGGSLSAGAYQYVLFKGGRSAGSENSWFLRNSVVAPAPRAPVDPVQPPVTTPVEIPAEILPTPAMDSPPLPPAVVGADPIPLYRLEVPVYSVVVPAAQLMLMNFLATFHDRQGEQSLLTETGFVPAGWGRVYGSELRKSWTGAASPRLDGSDQGFQVGHDGFASQTSDGLYQRAGMFVGKSRLRGDVDGFAGGFENTRAGKTKLNGEHIGAYWTISEPQGWYIDLVAMYSWLDGDSRSERGVKLDTKGHGRTLSAEGGYPIKVSDNWAVEPQVQIINQQIRLDGQNDGISDVSFDSQDSTTARLGARLKGRYQIRNIPVEPYLRANAWRTFGGYDTVTYNAFDSIKTEHKSSSADIGFGVVAQLSKSVSTYVSLDYKTNLDTNNQEGIASNAGVRISW
ncbi:autotransporter outer membrane beta-barrel domain-containing protein [Pseudomonas akapageensis]|uniref:autotransporter family protein n=1 Tax=Pseudomonas akapageensis TaxID=2609961 RepID=UPI001FE56FEA|nr:autotransporter outer membrane beta-barrel domain-containing protein [Pseudomonas akapageensis]